MTVRAGSRERWDDEGLALCGWSCQPHAPPLECVTARGRVPQPRGAAPLDPRPGGKEVRIQESIDGPGDSESEAVAVRRSPAEIQLRCAETEVPRNG